MTPSGDGSGGSLGTPESLLGGEGRSHFSRQVPLRVEKPWGYELIWARTAEYVGKLIHVRAGEALSLQFHEEKDETLFLYSGKLKLHLGAGLATLKPVSFKEGEAIRIRPGGLHRMEAVTDCTIFEASTPELDDVVRLEDRYGRVAGTAGSTTPSEPPGET